jgi:DNA replication protein DnaC
MKVFIRVDLCLSAVPNLFREFPQDAQGCTGGRLAPRERAAYACLVAKVDCPQCSGTGWKVVAGNERGAAAGKPQVFAVPCECGAEERTAKTIERARIPQRYLHCDFENFESDLPYDHGSPKEVAGWNRSLEQAKLVVDAFARDFPVGVEHGLLLMGPCGIGKTHLAVAALRQIVLRGHTGLFYDYRELLKEIQASYNSENQATEMGVLEPVLTAEVLLLDDLGASKPSLWTLETLGHILNTRYNEKRITLITTNFLDGEPLAASLMPSGRPTAVEDTLTDRVGKRIRSRLYEMCRTVEILAPDYRKEIRQASRFRA